MGAIFFYIFVYFLGYYASNVLNMLTVRPLVTNRYMAALVPVYGIAFAHAYMVVTRPLPAGADITVEYALLVFITLPVVVVTMGAAYFMWNSKGKDDHPEDHRESAGVATAETAAPDSVEQKVENRIDTAAAADTPAHADTGKNKESKDA
jgi:hypothetical protein